MLFKLIGFIFNSLFSKKPGISAQPIEIKKESLIKMPEPSVPTKLKHVNNGKCLKCLSIMDKFNGTHQGLKDWFILLQQSVPECHVSDGPRGKINQEEYYKKGTSKARYGQSSHNYGMALDLFKLHHTGAEWPKNWFEKSIKPFLDKHNDSESGFKIEWYGLPGSSFYELPHFEVKGWKTNPEKKLVEPAD